MLAKKVKKSEQLIWKKKDTGKKKKIKEWGNNGFASLGEEANGRID